MAELERDLRALGALVEYPAEPDLVPGVRARLGRPARRDRRRALVLVLAALAAALAVAFAVPPARSAILRFLHLGGVTVERVPTLPPAERRSPVAGLGGPMSLERASRVAGFPLLLPSFASDRAYAADGIAAVLLRAPGISDPVLLAEYRGEGIGIVKKMATGVTRLEPARVGDSDGLWIEGAPHVVTYLDANGRPRSGTTRLADDVLVWTNGSLTLRLEGRMSKGQALHIARLVR